MGYIRHTDSREWAPDFSTRQATHPYVNYKPIRQALSTTAATIVTAEGGKEAVNLMNNPRIDGSNISEFVEVGSTASQITSTQSLGTNSLSINPDNNAVGEGIYIDTPTIAFRTVPQYLTAQIEHEELSNDGTSIKLEIRDATGTTVHATTTAALAASFTRTTVAYAIPASTTAAEYRIYVVTATQHNTSFAIDKVMYEVREDTSDVSDYLDGDSGVNYRWTGVANASTSYKRHDLTVIRGVTLTNLGSAGQIVYLAFDTTASATTGIPIEPGATFENTWPLGFQSKVSVVAAAGTPTISGVIWGGHA